MDIDALAKAEWTLRNWIVTAVCGDACELTRQTCDGCPVKLLEKSVPHIARAVLEEAGIEEIAELLQESLRDAKEQLRGCAIYRVKQSCEPCRPGGCAPSDRIERIEATLRGLGKQVEYA